MAVMFVTIDERCGGVNPMTSSTSPASQTHPLIYSLRDREPAPIALVGGKGAKLARLAQAGFPVPDGFVITTAAYQAFLASNAIAPEDAPRSAADLEHRRRLPIGAGLRW